MGALLVHARRHWNRLLAERQGSLLQRTLVARLQLATGRGWGWGPKGGGQADTGEAAMATRLPAALAVLGIPVDLESPHPLFVAQLRRAALGRHLQEITAAAPCLAPPSSPAAWP